MGWAPTQGCPSSGSPSCSHHACCARHAPSGPYRRAAALITERPLLIQIEPAMSRGSRPAEGISAA